MEKLKQKINYLINRRNSFWATAMLTLGGVAMLLLRLNGGFIVYLLILVGLLASGILINGCIKQEELIEKLINKLEN